MEVNANARTAMTVAAVTALVIGARYRDWRIILAAWVVFYVLVYIAGGGRLPWKIKLKDYALYVLISISLVMASSSTHGTRRVLEGDHEQSPDSVSS
jgi:hypothetical protein